MKKMEKFFVFTGYDENYREIKITAHDAHGCIIMSDATYIKTREE